MFELENICICDVMWWNIFPVYGWLNQLRMVPDPEKFPNGIKFLADYFHERFSTLELVVNCECLTTNNKKLTIRSTQGPPIGHLQQRREVHLLRKPPWLSWSWEVFFILWPGISSLLEYLNWWLSWSWVFFLYNAIVILILVFQVCIGTDNRLSPQGGRCLLTGMGNRLLQVKHLFRIELFSIRRYDNCYPRIDGTTNIGGTYIDFQAICKTQPILISKYSIFILCCAGISYECSQW